MKKDKRESEDGEFSSISEAKKSIDSSASKPNLDKNGDIWVGEGDLSRTSAVKKAMAQNTAIDYIPRTDGIRDAVMLIHWNGRFGNRLHQYAYGATYAKVNDMDFQLPSEWEGTHIFKNQKHSVVEDDG
jgi:hypothetical protein